MSKIQLNEQLLEKADIIKEGLPKGIIARIDYPIMRFGVKNANNRIYEREVAEAVMSNLNVQGKLKTRTLFGNAEHPSESQVKLNKDETSHIISSLHINEDTKVLYATLDLLPTEAGKFINILLEAGCLVGTSTRADGELEEKVDEADGSKYSRVIPSSYVFQTLDFTGDPSTPDAVPENIIKAVESHYASKDINKNVAVSILETVKTEASKKLIENIKNDKQHIDCKQSIHSKSCATCFHAKEAVAVKEDTKKNQPVTKLEVNIDKQVDEFLTANRQSFKDKFEAKDSLIKVFKITPEKANEYIEKMLKGETPIEVKTKVVEAVDSNKVISFWKGKMSTRGSSPFKATKYTAEEFNISEFEVNQILQDYDKKKVAEANGFNKFDKYLHKNDKLFFKIAQRAIELGEKHGIATEDYVADLEAGFEPDAYRKMSDADLLKDIQVYNKEANEGKDDNVCPKCKQHSGFWYKKIAGKEVKVCAAKNCNYTEPVGEAVVPELVDDGMKDLYIQEIVKLSQELAEAKKTNKCEKCGTDELRGDRHFCFKCADKMRKEAEDKNKVDTSEIVELRAKLVEADKKFQSVKMTADKAAKLEKELEEDEKRIAALKAENENLKESHRHDLVKMYSDSRIKALGLKLPKQLNLLLEACKDNNEVDRTIRSIQNSIRESIVTSASLSEITVNNDIPKDGKQLEIDKTVSNAFKGFGM